VSDPGGFAGPRPGRVAIVGAGQVGTAIGMALTAAGPPAAVEEVALFDREERVAEESLERGAGHRIADGIDGVLSADTMVLAIPVDQIVAFLDRFGASVGPGTLVIDTGSAKVAVVEAMRRSVPANAHALGGHPIAGTERPGPEGADPGLLSGAPFVLCPVREDPAAIAGGRTLAAAIGAAPVEMTAEAHDRVVARTSHLPHIAAFALASVAGAAAREESAGVRLLVGSGFRGATRLAAGDPAMIGGFLHANAAEAGRAVDELIEELQTLRRALAGPAADLMRALERGRRAREAVA
jgi:prephenate dehydrogenase